MKQKIQPCRRMFQTDVMTVAEHYLGRRHVPGNEPKLLRNISNRCCFHKHRKRHYNQRIIWTKFYLNTLEYGSVTASKKMKTDTICMLLHHFSTQGLRIPIKAENPLLPTACFGRSALRVCFQSRAARRWEGGLGDCWETGAKTLAVKGKRNHIHFITVWEARVCWMFPALMLVT